MIKKISVFRSREMSATIIIQAKSQLKTMYKDSADTIIGSCDSILFLGSNEYDTFEWLSKMLGKETIDTRSFSISEGEHGSYSRSEQKTGRELMTPDEIRTLSGQKCILLIRGLNPFLSNKFMIDMHKNYDQLFDGIHNVFRLEKYIEKKIDKKLVLVADNKISLYKYKE